ncbi:MAG: serine hydrolase [Spirochaetes bacterium]|nr:serine hydrolase [Spirochaetota bacterium]
MIKKKILIITAVVLAVLAAAYALTPAHVKTAFKYLGVTIDDHRLFANRTVTAGAGQPWALDPDYNKKEIPAKYASMMRDLKTAAFLVVRNNRILTEKYWDGYSDQSVTNSFSAAKSIVGLLVGIALDEGKIKSLNQPVGDFIPEFKAGMKGAITVKDVLTMSSGIDWNESYVNPFSITAKAYFGDDLDSLTRGLDAAEPAGKSFKYLSGNTQILGLIVEKAAGERISLYASEKLWKPLGAGKDALWSLDREGGMEKAFCCFYAGARDYARIGQLILNGGTWNGRRIISKQYLDAATTAASWLKDEEGKPVDFYGYQIWIMRHRGLVIPHFRGIKGQYILIIPQKNAVVVRLGSKRIDKKIRHIPADSYEYVDAALALIE